MSTAPVRVAIVGTGLAARVQADVLTAIEAVTVVGFASQSLERAQTLAERYPGARCAPSLAALLELRDADLVSVTSAPAGHCPVSIAAARAGKAVLCEKPFALNAGEAKAMLDAVAKSGVQSFVNFEFRRFSPRAVMQRLIADGYVGDIRTLSLTASSNYYQLKGDQQSPWWLSSEQGGGWLGAAGSHDLDMLRFIAGEVTEVSADLPRFVDEHGVRGMVRPMKSDVDDAAHLLLRFESGARGVLANTAAGATPTEGTRIEVYGDRGTLILDTPTRSGGPMYAGTKLQGRRIGDDDFTSFAFETPVATGADVHTGPTDVWLRDVVQALQTGTPTSPDFRDGFEDQVLIDAARRSDALGRWVATSEIKDELDV